MNNTILRDGGLGIYVYSPYAEVTAENSLIADNAYTGIFVRADSRHSFKNCTIVGNGFAGTGWSAAGIHLGGSILTLENSVVAFNKTGLHHSGDIPTATIRNSLFHNPGGQEIVWDGDPGMPDLAADGNMTADPLFVNRPGRDYELASGSPAIDAGTGIQAPATDLLGRARYDDRGMPNVGYGYPSYVDIGAFERQEDSPRADLAVTHVSNPDQESVTLADAVTVVKKGKASFTASLSMPAVARPGRVIEFRVQYTNTGEIDIPTPVLTLDSGLQDTAWKLPSCGEWVEGPVLRCIGKAIEISRAGFGKPIQVGSSRDRIATAAEVLAIIFTGYP